MFTRDPVSVLWDTAARQALKRAQEARGRWVGVPLRDPSPGLAAWILAAHGIDVTAPDNVTGRAARTRWARGFVRAVNYHAPGPVQVQVGVRIRGGRAARVRVHRGGDAAMRAVGRSPLAGRIYNPDGTPGARWADPDDRDW